MGEVQDRETRQAGQYLHELVSGPYRNVWVGHASRVRPGEVNKLAVASVLAEHLWDTGERSDTERDLAHQLRDRVGRALAGEVLTPVTLRWFIDAFRMADDHSERLWTLLNGPEKSTVPDDGWYVDVLETVLEINADRPVATERRIIVATRDDLDKITTSVSVPRALGDRSPEHGLEVEVLSGGELVGEERLHESHFRQAVALPAPLRRGEKHEYVIRRTPPAGQPMALHYVSVPYRRIDSFHLEVRFDRFRRPAAVWRLDGVPSSVVYDLDLRCETIPHQSGTVRTSFFEMVQGMAYGLRWS